MGQKIFFYTKKLCFLLFYIDIDYNKSVNLLQ